DIQDVARRGRATARPRWPMLVLRTPKGWTGPATVDDVPVEGTWRAHQVPLSEVRTNAEHRAALERWLRSYRPEELFDEHGWPRSTRRPPSSGTARSHRSTSTSRPTDE